MPTKTSHGIALCKRGADGIVRLLMINKRYTYAFFAFACGRYNENNNDELVALFDKMTIDEKIDILSMNFQQVWYRVWLGYLASSNMFILSRNKYNEYIVADGGAHLKMLMRRSRRYAARIWEIPKGRKKNIGEGELDCAIREFYEETGIPRNAYHITDGTYKLVFTEEGVRYDITYYIALTTRDIVQRINSASLEQVGEICDMRWISGAEIGFYATRDPSGHRRIIHYAKARLRSPFVPVLT